MEAKFCLFLVTTQLSSLYANITRTAILKDIWCFVVTVDDWDQVAHWNCYNRVEPLGVSRSVPTASCEACYHKLDQELDWMSWIIIIRWFVMELLSYFGSEIFMTPLLKARSTMTNINCINGVSNNDFLQNVQLISKEMFGFTCTIFYFVNAWLKMGI